MALGAAEISLRAIRTEFVGPAGEVSLRAYKRGGSYVRDKAANDQATNMAASVPTSSVNMRAFRSTERLFKYTNAAVINNSTMQAWFGDDWAIDYPKTFVNNNSCHATNTSNWGFRVDGGAGTRTLINNGNILGAGGASESAGGGNALYCNSLNLILINNSQIFAGGGGGGHGGAGGAGGGGFYDTPRVVQEGPTFANVGSPLSANYFWNAGGSVNYFWDGEAQVSGVGSGATSHAYGAWIYYRSTYSGQSTLYYILRQQTVYDRTYVNPGGGGAGGTGGRGQGADGAAAGGSAGAAGGNAGGNSGVGGTGGAGGTGGGWGANGATGATGAAGAGGNWYGGAAGAGGTAGGTAGYYLYREKTITNTVVGSVLGRLF